MIQQKIICPECKCFIPMDKALSQSIRESYQKEFEADIKKKEEELLKKEEALISKKVQLEKEWDAKLKEEKEKLEEKLKKKTEDNFIVEIKDLKEQLQEKAEQIEKSQKIELELRKRQREVEEDKKTFELQMTRKLDEERDNIIREAVKKIDEEHTLQIKDKEKQIEDLHNKIEHLKRNSEQSSQKLKGEVLELQLESILKNSFPDDHIYPVPSGKKGADVVQEVYNNMGKFCGTILWESKRTKSWNEEWITKLKDDQIQLKAEIGIIVTTTLPKEITGFAYKKGVWITGFSSIKGIAAAMRISLVQIANIKSANVGKNEKMELLYNYLSGPEFRQKIEAIVESFSQMKKDIDIEKQYYYKAWSKREKQIERVICNTACFYGDMQGIIGASLPEIQCLQLNALAPGEEIEDFQKSM